MTPAQRWADVSARYEAKKGNPPAPRQPTMTQHALMLCITALYYYLYEEHGADACGEVGTEPRDTWDAGGNFYAGHRAIWGL